MSSKRNRRGHRLIRRLAQSHTASGGDTHTFIFWKYRNELCFRHYMTMCKGLEYGYNFYTHHRVLHYRQMVARIYRNSQPSARIEIHRI